MLAEGAQQVLDEHRPGRVGARVAHHPADVEIVEPKQFADARGVTHSETLPPHTIDFPVMTGTVTLMEREDELSFADQVGRYFTQRYGMAPVTGRVLGWLMICDPPEQTPAALAETLGASRSSIGTAVTLLERNNLIQRTRPAGERADRVWLDPEAGARDLDDPQQYLDQAALAHRGLAILANTEPRRRARLLEMAALSEFLAKRTPELAAEWRAHRDALRAAGDLPSTSSH
jgi:DNA-binding MarR family transcriptional regulator